MDWNRFVIIGAQCVVVVVLGACVATGHNSHVTDGLLAVSGSIAGIGLYSQVKGKAPGPPHQSTEDAQ